MINMNKFYLIIYIFFLYFQEPETRECTRDKPCQYPQCNFCNPEKEKLRKKRGRKKVCIKRFLNMTIKEKLLYFYMFFYYLYMLYVYNKYFYLESR